jgi:hypothetical protein
MDHKSIGERLGDELRQATEGVQRASEAFIVGTSEMPSGSPRHSEDPNRIQGLSREYRAARQDVFIANRRLDSFMVDGVTPEDLE